MNLFWWTILTGDEILELNGDWKEKQLQGLIIRFSTAFFIALNISMRFIQECDDSYLLSSFFLDLSSNCRDFCIRLIIMIYLLLIPLMVLYCKERLVNRNRLQNSSPSNSQRKFVSKTYFFAITIGIIISIQVDVIITVLEEFELIREFSLFLREIPLMTYFFTLVFAEILGQLLEYLQERQLKNILNKCWNRFFDGKKKGK